MGHRRARSPLAALITVFSGVLLLLSPVAATAAFGTETADTPTDDATPAPGSTTWAIAPGGADGPDGRVSMRHILDPGAQVSDQVVVTNFSDQSAIFRIYASDGVVTDEGNFDLIPADEAATGGGSWITLGPVTDATDTGNGSFRVEIPAGGTLVVPVEIAVPADVSPGDHPAGIVAELLQEGDSPVQFTSRVGVRAHLRATGDVVAKVTPQNVETTFHPSWNPFTPGTLEVRYDLTNEGNVRLGGDVTTAATGFFGIALASDSTEVREILPAQSTGVSEEFTIWPLFFTWGEIQATPVIVGDDTVTAELDPTTTEFTAWTIPWSQLAILVVLVGGFFLIRGLRIRSKARTQAQIDAAVAAAQAGNAP